MMLPNVTNRRSASTSTASSTACRPSIFGANVRSNVAASTLVSAAGSLRPAPCSTPLTGPSRAVSSPIARETAAGSVTSARAYATDRPPSAIRDRFAPSSASCAGSDRPRMASFAPVSRATASAHSAVMPLPPPVTSSTSLPSSGSSVRAGSTGITRSVGIRRTPSAS